MHGPLPMAARASLALLALLAFASVAVRATGTPLGEAPPAMAPRSQAERALVSQLSQRWQGAWVVRNAAYPGEVEAWSVRGDEVIVYHPTSGQKETQRFALQSPCRLVRSRRLEGGGEAMVTTNTFAFAPDGPHVGPPQAAAGLRRGDMLTMCIGDHVYTYDERTRSCQRWARDMGGPPRPVAECDRIASPPSFVLRRADGSGDVRLTFAGDALLSPAMQHGAAERQRTFFAAMQRARALVKR